MALSRTKAPVRLGAPGRVLELFVVAQWSAFAVLALVRGERRIIAYALVWSLLAVAVRSVHRRRNFSRPMVAALAVAGLLHLIGGLLPSPDQSLPTMYETWLVPGIIKYDQFAHFVICAVVTTAVYQQLAGLLRADIGWVPRALLAVTVTGGLGAINELFEFLSALRFPDSYSGDLTNTGWDLAFNLAGSVAAAIVCGQLDDPTRSMASSDEPSATHRMASVVQ